MSDPNTIKGTLRVKQGKKQPSFMVEVPTKKGTAALPIAMDAKGFQDADASDGMEVDVVRTGGRVTMVTIPGKAQAATTSREEAMKQDRGGRGPRHHGGGRPMGGNRGAAREDGHAVYNFVPVDQNRVARGFVAPRPGDDTVSGTIQCTLEALTPLIVGGPGERDRPADRPADRKQPKLIEWCTADGRPVIPGTSLKGCFRQALESLSFGGLWPTSEVTMAARDVSNARSDYHARLQRVGGARGGWLVKNGPRWTLRPCTMASADTEGLLKATGVMRSQVATSGGAEKTEAWRRAGGKSVGVHLETTRTRDGEERLEASNLGGGGQEAWPVFSGFIQKKKRDTVFLADAGEAIEVSESVWNAFRDQQSDAQAKLWKAREEASRALGLPGIPVFWLPSDSSGRDVDVIGLTRFMRIPVRHQPRDLAPKAEDDLATTLFGFVDHGGTGARRGRAWFGAGRLEGTVTPTAPTSPVVPGQPQPSAVSVYVRQDPSQVGTFGRYGINEGLRDYDSDQARLRGRKLYWHRDPEFPPPPNDNVNVQARYRPLPTGTSFTFEVFLDGVSRTEAGAIIAALDLPEGHAHRLGGGKPFGLGSVRVRVDRIDLKDDRRRAGSLAARRSEAAAIVDPETCREAFVNDIAHRVGFEATAFESQPEIKAFRRLSDHANRPKNSVTEAMPLNDMAGGPSYKVKPILPDAVNVR